MTKDEALKQARDALKNLPGFLADVETAIDACDEALAQPSHPLKPVSRDDTEHGKAYYLASDVDALLERLAGGGKVMQPSKREDMEELVQRLMYLHNHQLATKSIYSEAADAIKTQAQPAQEPLTNEAMELMLPSPDGSAESDVKRVEVLPGVFGQEHGEVDAWSKALVLQFGRDLLAAHGITGGAL